MEKTDAETIALLMYASEPCRICGETITKHDLRDAVFAGYSVCGKSRSAHGYCWTRPLAKSDWAFPYDADEHKLTTSAGGAVDTHAM